MLLHTVFLAGMAYSAMPDRGQCKCNGTSGKMAGHGVSCASWDAPDETPWCHVDKGACGDEDTFESQPGVWWSHGPCKGMAAGIATAEATAMSKTKKGRVAIAITLTKDGDEPYLDGAAVLKQSMEQTHSAWDIDFVAIVHPSVKLARAPLVKLGYKIREKRWPFDSSGIKKAHLRETIDKSGCCGMAELIKLSAWEMVQYHRVMLLDSDSLVLHNVDELFDLPHVFLYTYDRNMDGPWSSHPPVQGGFFVLKPDMARYQELEDTVREGDFREGSGWGGCVLLACSPAGLLACLPARAHCALAALTSLTAPQQKSWVVLWRADDPRPPLLLR